MQKLLNLYRHTDMLLTEWMARHGVTLLRVSIGVIFFWFGFLKFFPGLSPAEELATRTISEMTFGLLDPNLSRILLASWECLIGLGLIVGRAMRATLLLLVLHMLGTMAPLFIFPDEVFVKIPFVPTLEGQYIIKNLVLISGAIVVGSTVRGGRVIADPRAAQIANERIIHDMR